MNRLPVEIAWTETARECLRALPPKVRRGLIEKADELLTCSDPRAVHKPLTGPLEGCYRITYSRYRAIYRVDEERDDRGRTVLRLRVLFLFAGIRRSHSKDDIYRVAEKLLRLGLLKPQ